MRHTYTICNKVRSGQWYFVDAMENILRPLNTLNDWKTTINEEKRQTDQSSYFCMLKSFEDYYICWIAADGNMMPELNCQSQVICY